MRKRLSDYATVVERMPCDAPGYAFEPGPGPFPYYGKPLASGMREIDDWNVDGTYVVLHNGVRCRSQKNTFLASVVQGKAFADETQLVLAVEGRGEAEFLKRVLANTDTTGILLKYLTPDCHIDVEALMGIEFYVPEQTVLEPLMRAYRACDQIVAAAQEESRVLPLLVDRLCDRILSERSDTDGMKPLGQVAQIQAGRDLSFSERVRGEVPIVSMFGVSGHHDRASAEGPSIVVGLKGGSFSMLWVEEPCWPVGSVLYLDEKASSIPLELIFGALAAWARRENGPRFSTLAEMELALRDIMVPGGETAAGASAQALRVALLRRNEQCKKLALVKELQEDHLDLLATGLQ